MKILITGGTGFIGFHLANLHLRRGDTIFLIDNLFAASEDLSAPLRIFNANLPFSNEL